MNRFFGRRWPGCAWLLSFVLAGSPTASAWGAPTRTAADFVPADCAFFTTSLRLRQQYDVVAGSRAVRKLLELPLVQQQLEEWKNEEELAPVLAVLEQPLAQDILAACQDAFSKEVFCYAEKGWVELARLVQGFQFENLVNTLSAAASGQEPNPVPAIVNLVLKNPQLTVPGSVVGFAVTDQKRIETLLDQLRVQVAQAGLPLEIGQEEIGQGRFHVYRLSGRILPRDQMMEGLVDAGVTERKAERFADWLMGQSFTLAMGLYQGHFLISIGSDTAHLARLGKGDSLADLPALAPAARHVSSENLVGLSYASRDLMSIGQFEEMADEIEEGLGLVGGFLPEGLSKRLAADVPRLLGELAELFAKPSEVVSVSLLNRGIENYTYTRSANPGADYSRPLTVLRKAGAQPLLAWAGGRSSSIERYGICIGWSKTLYRYWVDFGLPMLEEDDRQVYEQAAEVAIPFLESIEKISREKLLPSIDRGQTLFILDTQLRIEPVFGPVAFPKPMPMFELAIGCTIADRDSFLAAMNDYVVAIEAFAPKIAPLLDQELPDPFRIPRPTVTPFGAEASMYFYGAAALATLLGPDVLPHAVVTKDTVVLALSPKMSRRMLESERGPTDDVVPLDQPAGSIIVCRPGGLWAGVREWIDFAAQIPDSPLAPEDPDQRELIRTHIDVVLDVLATFKGASVRSYRQGEHVVQHSWLHFEDLAD